VQPRASCFLRIAMTKESKQYCVFPTLNEELAEIQKTVFFLRLLCIFFYVNICRIEFLIIVAIFCLFFPYKFEEAMLL